MSDTLVHAYHYLENRPLKQLAAERWASFCGGDTPLDVSSYDKSRGVAKVWVLLVTIRGGAIDAIEPFAIEVDAQGYLRRRAIDPLPDFGAAAGLVDGRGRFIRRYLRHTHEWHPPPATLAEVIRRSSPAPMPRAAEPRR